MRQLPVTHIQTITTRVEREDDSRSITRLETQAADLQCYGRAGYDLASTITVPAGAWTQ